MTEGALARVAELEAEVSVHKETCRTVNAAFDARENEVLGMRKSIEGLVDEKRYLTEVKVAAEARRNEYAAKLVDIAAELDQAKQLLDRQRGEGNSPTSCTSKSKAKSEIGSDIGRANEGTQENRQVLATRSELQEREGGEQSQRTTSRVHERQGSEPDPPFQETISIAGIDKAESQRQTEAESPHQRQYLKHTVLMFMQATEAQERVALLPVLAALLKFDSKEAREARRAAERPVARASSGFASFFGP